MTITLWIGCARQPKKEPEKVHPAKLSTLGLLSLLPVLLVPPSFSKPDQEAVTTPPGQVSQGILVLEGATLISPEREAPLADSAIVVRGNRVEAVGKIGSVSYPPGARVLQVTGKYVIPGLIDTHVHLEGEVARISVEK